MEILVINCGSSSLKYQLFDMERKQLWPRALSNVLALPAPVNSFPVPGKMKSG